MRHDWFGLKREVIHMVFSGCINSKRRRIKRMRERTLTPSPAVLSKEFLSQDPAASQLHFPSVYHAPCGLCAD